MSKSETEPQFTTEGEKRFKGAYSKALADALRENENKGPSNSEDEVFDAYVALCYDDPIVPSNEACRALASALLPHEKNKKYALSNPLLQGLLQVTTSSRWNNNNNNKAATETSTMLTNNNATAPGYAELAYSVLCQGPLLCLQHNAQKDSMDIARAFLGTYAPHQEDTFTTRETTEKNVDNFIQQMIDMNDTTTDNRNDGGSNNNLTSSTCDVVDNDEEDSLQEKFANDSDPDDFDYGDDNLCHFPFQKQHPPQQEEAVFFFDPVTLSQPQVLLSPEEIQERFRCLLSELSYHRIKCFDAKRWKELGVSKTLVDLTLILLSEDDNSFLPPNKGELYTKPLFALRDRALNSSHQDAAMEDYIRLIHMLLSSSSNSSTSSFPCNSRDVPLKLMVGFWSLSSLCASSPSEDLGTTTSQSKPQKNKIRECIFDNLDPLVDIMNQIYPPSSSLDGVRTMMNMLPILNVITGSSSKVRMVLSKEESQLLLQSGYFRELILTSIRTTANEASAPNEAIRQQLLRHILILSSQSPQILGKYATGVPHLIDEVLSGSSDNNDGLKKVDTILWFALVTSLNNDDVSTTTVLLRKGQASKQQLLSREKLCVLCLNEFVLLCQQCTAEMRMWMKNRVNSTGDEKRSDGNIILDLMEFTNLVARLPYLAHAFVSALSHVEGGIHTSNDELNVIQHALLSSSSLVKPSSMAESTMERKKLKDDERKKLKDIPHQNPAMGVLDENSLALVRKGIKALTLLLDNNDAPSSSTTHGALSSKTD